MSLTFERLHALQPGEAGHGLAGDGEDLVALRHAAPAAGRAGRGGVRAAALRTQGRVYLFISDITACYLNIQPPHALARPAAALEPQAEAELLAGPAGDGDVLLGEVAGWLGLLVQALDGDVPGGGGEARAW